jgi:type IV pilus assembly protein PilQ
MITNTIAAALLLPRLLAAAPDPGEATARVTGLRVAPAGSGTELVIEVAGPLETWTDAALANPARVVVDLPGTRASLVRSRFDGIDRGGIAGVRTSQYSDDAVRVVVDLQHPMPYTVTRAADGLHVRFDSRSESFSPWSTAGETAAAAAQPRRAPSQARITVSFQDADIRDVLSSIAEFAGRSIVPGVGVEGTVTATIRDQPWDVALRTILDAYGYAAQELSTGIIQVDKLENLQKRRTDEPLSTRTFRINYVPAEEIEKTLEPLKSDRGKISFNASTNTLIVTEVASALPEIERMIQRLDVRTPQVTIEAKIIFVNRTKAQELGFTYDLKDRSGNSFNRLARPQGLDAEAAAAPTVTVTGNSVAALGNANVRVQGPQLEAITSLVLGRFTLLTFIDALQSLELSDVQAAPVITTLDNQEAQIKVGERTPIRVVDLATPGGGGGGGGSVSAPRATAQMVETGIILRVTPHITADGRVLMQIHAERSNAQLAATDIGVNFQEQVGETRLMVRDGETAVIGGLTVTETGSTRAGIPFLMDLPVVGALFRTDRTREQKRDLLIMVTPHVVDDRAPTALND